MSFAASKVNTYVWLGDKVLAAKVTVVAVVLELNVRFAPFLSVQGLLVALLMQPQISVIPERAFKVGFTSGSATVADKVSAFWVETVWFPPPI